MIFGTNGVCPKSLFKIVLPFCLIWCVTNYCYTRALGKVAVTDVTAMFASCNAFVYMFSLLILKEPFMLLRVSYLAFYFILIYLSKIIHISGEVCINKGSICINKTNNLCKHI